MAGEPFVNVDGPGDAQGGDVQAVEGFGSGHEKNIPRMTRPLVFLILPISVLFAIFPGVFMLRLGIG